MFRFFRIVFLLGLSGAVVGLGLKIYLATSKIDGQAPMDSSQIKSSLEKTKRIAKEKVDDIKKIINSIEEESSQAKHEKSGTEKAISLNSKSNSEPARLRGLDDEDAMLTAQVLNPQEEGLNEDVKAEGLQHNTGSKSAAKESYDFEKVKRIQEFYTQAAQILNLD